MNLFENEFSNYIREQKNHDYVLHIKKKLADTIIDTNPKFKIDAFSFNYTLGRLDKPLSDLKSLINKWINVHGYVGIYYNMRTTQDNSTPIIFGIDSKSVLGEKKELIPFTKAYRRLEINKIENSLPQDINKIIFMAILYLLQIIRTLNHFLICTSCITQISG